MRTFKQRLIDCSNQDWCSRIAICGKARYNKLIIPALRVASYIHYYILFKGNKDQVLMFEKRLEVLLFKQKILLSFVVTFISKRILIIYILYLYVC